MVGHHTPSEGARRRGARACLWWPPTGRSCAPSQASRWRRSGSRRRA